MNDQKWSNPGRVGCHTTGRRCFQAIKGLKAKRYLAVLLAFVLAFSLAACGGGNDTPAPSGSDGNPNDGNNPTETGWWTKPYHLKLSKYYPADDATREIEVLFNGEEILIWLGNNGEYAYMQDGKLWSATMQKDDPGSYSAAENENHSTVLAYMEHSAYPGGLLNDYEKFTSTPDMWEKQGSETVEGFNCTAYSAEYNDGTVKIWIDESKGMVIKREAPNIYEDGKTALDYVVTSFVTENVPSVSSVYQLPDEGGNTSGGNSKPDNGDSKWPEGELPNLVPAPGFEYGIAGNYETLFTIYYSDVSLEDLRTYAEQVEEAGFNVDPKLTDDGTIFTFTASNSNGYAVTIGKQMMEISKPE